MTERFSRTSRFPVDVHTLFAWHERPGAFERLAPPWDKPEVVEAFGGIRDGARVTIRVAVGPLSTTWEIEHRDYIPDRQFRDVMLSGPFTTWSHTHSFASINERESELTDTIEFELPLGAVGATLGNSYAKETLQRVFAYRHELLANDLRRHAQYAQRPRLRIAMSGATGFIGSQLSAFLSTGGHTVLRIGRTDSGGKVDIAWDPARGTMDSTALEGVDAVIHLAGAPIAERWSAAQKRAIRDSRIEGTSLLSHTLARLKRKPKVLLSGSAIGYYGSRADELLDERSRPGDDWLAQVAAGWENATQPAEQAGIRVVRLRTGIVQGAAGGALAKQLPLFRNGAGGRLGSGQQWLSPIALDDVIGAIHFLLMRDDARGPVNLVAPEALTNAEYTDILASVLHRPAWAHAPALALKLALGEMAEGTVLASQRVMPSVLTKAGFQFRYPKVEQMLRFELGLTEVP